jgi:hypothetical protein
VRSPVNSKSRSLAAIAIRIHLSTVEAKSVHRLAIGRLLRLDTLDAIQECGAE